MSESTGFRTYKALANATAHTYIDFGLNRQIWVDENYSTKAVDVIYKFYWLKLVMCHAISRMLHFRSDHTVVKSVLQGVAPILKKPSDYSSHQWLPLAKEVFVQCLQYSMVHSWTLQSFIFSHYNIQQNEWHLNRCPRRCRLPEAKDVLGWNQIRCSPINFFTGNNVLIKKEIFLA